MKKIGFLVMALVLALGGLGVGYAHWFDTITITQVVQTGEVSCGVFGIAVEEYEDKEVCDVVVDNVGFRFDKFVCAPSEALYTTGQQAHYASSTISIDNLYPAHYVLEDWVISNAGTIPVKLEVTYTANDAQGLYNLLDVQLWRVYEVWVDEAGNCQEVLLDSGAGKLNVVMPLIIDIVEGYQLHPCHSLVIYLDKILPQEGPQGESTMGLSANFTMSIDCMQWNLYTPPTPDVD
jgi:hypothetical protein